MKTVTTPILRRFGFRDTLVWNALIASACLAVCAAFRPGWPVLAINGVLFVAGFFQSLQYTALNTIAYADIAPERMSSATSFYSTFQQLMLSMGICVSSTALGASMALSGHPVPHLGDFSVAFLVVTGISILAAPVCARMAPEAGAAMSGHGGRR
jgi:MFS family permease